MRTRWDGAGICGCGLTETAKHSGFFSWKLSSFLIQVFDLKEAHKSCRSQAITHSVLSRAGHVLEADPGDPKHSSVPFPMKVDFIL